MEPTPTTAEPALVVSHLTKRFGSRLAFDDVSFTVARGEVFGFLGPNGAGKTTMVRTLGTLLAPSTGSATVVGLPLDGEHGVEIRSRTAVMPESPGLYVRLTVRENLECFADLYEADVPRTAIEHALAAVDLTDRADDPCGTLSKGLRQRVALARALLSSPELLFLDEPTAGLDPVAAQDVYGLVEGLRKRGATIFLTTHRLEEAERLCDRVAILNTTLRTIGPPNELRNRLFATAVQVRTAAPLADPDAVFGPVARLQPLAARRRRGLSRHGRRPGRGRTGHHPGARRRRCRRPRDRREPPLARGRLPPARRRRPGAGGPMSLDLRRVRAIIRKELREIQHNRSLLLAMAVLPLVFIIQPLIAVLGLSAKAASGLSHEHVLLYLLGIPVLVPPVIAATAIAGERQQGTLEPVLTTPIRREELLLGKALAAWVPSIAIAYLVDALFLAIVAAVRPTRDRVGDGQRVRPRRAGVVRAAPRRLVDLGRAGDVDARERRTSRPAALAAGEPARRARRGADRARRDLALAGARCRAGRAVRRPGHRRLVGHLEAVRSRATDRRHAGLT